MRQNKHYSQTELGKLILEALRSKNFTIHNDRVSFNYDRPGGYPQDAGNGITATVSASQPGDSKADKSDTLSLSEKEIKELVKAAVMRAYPNDKNPTVLLGYDQGGGTCVDPGNGAYASVTVNVNVALV